MENKSGAIKWSLAIQEARTTLEKISNHQMKIADLALSVCEITHGGASKKYESMYTMTRFAREVGMNFKTLSNWIGIKKLVYEKLTPAQRKEAQFSDLVFVSHRIDRKMPRTKVQEVYEDYLSCDTFERKIIRYMCDLRSLYYNFNKQGATFKVSENTLKEILFFTRKIEEKILEDRPQILPKLTGATMRVKASAGRALLEPRT